MKLDPRLKALARMVTAGELLVDVGADHAYLTIHLIHSKGFTRAIAIEKNRGPYQAAKGHIKREGLEEKIEVRLGDGLEPLSLGEAQTVVIAGLGGHNISDILGRGKALLQGCKQLVLQAQNAQAKVRKTLYDIGFHIDEEDLVKDGDRFYVLISARPGARAPLSWANLHFGPKLLESRPTYLVEYMKEILKAREGVLSGLKGSSVAQLARQDILEKEIYLMGKLVEEYGEKSS